LLIFVAFAAGTMLADAFLHLLPESLSLGENLFIYVLLGILLFFSLEKFLYWRHCHDDACNVHPVTYLNLIGDGIHNFIDGMIIAASFMGSMQLGVTTTLAVAMHEIPQELGDFSVLIHGGLEAKKALLFNFLSALTAVAGALFVYFFISFASFGAYLLPFAAGGFIYIASSDLIPELHKVRKSSDSMAQFLVFLFGIALMWAFKIVFG
jgi:zinc and cadmium transporter